MIFVFVFVVTLYEEIRMSRKYKICIVYLNELVIILSFYTILTYLVLYVSSSVTLRLKVIYIGNQKIKWKSVNSFYTRNNIFGYIL